jgi:double zinc ribbon protein
MSSCPFCSHSNPAGAKFCNDCGSPLTLKPCRHCEAVNDVAAVECHRCGAPLDVPAVKSGDAAVLLQHPRRAREAAAPAKTHEPSEAVARQQAHVANDAGTGSEARETNAGRLLPDGAQAVDDGAAPSGPAATDAHTPESIFERMERGIDARLAGEWAKPHEATGDAEPVAAVPHVVDAVANAISGRPRASASVAAAMAAKPRARASVADALPRAEPRGRAPASRTDRRRARASSGLLGAAIALAVLALGVAGYFAFLGGAPGSRSDSAVAFGERQGNASAAADGARASGSPGVATKSSTAEAGANRAVAEAVQPGAPGVRAPHVSGTPGERSAGASGAPASTSARSASRSAASTTAADPAQPASRTRRPSDAAAIATQRLIERDMKPFLRPGTTGTEANTYPAIN